MKALKIDFEYYEYPKSINSLEEFIFYLNGNYHSFIPMRRFKQDECRAPYFIEGQYEDIYINVASFDYICEEEITILSKEEYDARLEKIVSEKCVYCINYTDDSEGDNLIGHRTNISLDGECYMYKKDVE